MGNTRWASAIAGAFIFGALFLTADTVGAQTIRACFNNTNGNMRLVSSAADCRTNETFLTWNAAGSAGATGPTGAAGPVGPTGPAGTNGTNGAVGPTGPAGTNGAVGPTGPAGSTGAIGPTGPQGPTGSFTSTPPSFAVFPAGTGGPTVPHFAAGNEWVLEALEAGTLQLRSTAANFFVFSFIAPTSCSGQTASTSEAFRFSFNAVGDTLTAAFCPNVGSTILVTVTDFSQSAAVFTFRCQRTHLNANICQRLF